ncbi:MAG: type II toxin-antitoxin system HicB family antitoxin [Geminicoccaceae bacterium]
MSLEYKGYIAGRIEFDDGAFSGIVAGLRDVIHFEGATAAELEQAFRDSIDAYLDFCARRGETPDKPYSGHVMIRIDPDLHRKAATRAEAEDLSLNAWIAKQIEAA